MHIWRKLINVFTTQRSTSTLSYFLFRGKVSMKWAHPFCFLLLSDANLDPLLSWIFVCLLPFFTFTSAHTFLAAIIILFVHLIATHFNSSTCVSNLSGLNLFKASIFSYFQTRNNKIYFSIKDLFSNNSFFLYNFP